MAITPNYSWPLPDDEDLVKDGAEAIRDLGNAIDTTVDGLPSGGLVHINTTSFSASAGHSIPDNSFSSTYDHYRIVIRGTSSATNEIRLRYRASGSDDSTSNYYWSNVLTRTTAVQSLFGGGAVNISTIIRPSTTGGFRAAFDVMSPVLSAITTALGNSTGTDGTGTHLLNFFSTYLGTASFDSLSFLASSGNITGSVSVFGYQKA